MKLIFSFLLLLPLFVKAQGPEKTEVTGSPEALIKNIFAIAQKENPLLNLKNKNELDGHFDFHQMSLTILGDEVKKRVPGDIKWFENSIKEIITKTVYPKAPVFLKNVKIAFKSTIIDGNKAIVPSIVSKKGENTDVSYTLLKNGESWKVVDVSIDEESWVKTINEKMLKSFREKGWNGVKELLTNRIKDLNKKK